MVTRSETRVAKVQERKLAGEHAHGAGGGGRAVGYAEL